MTHLWAAAFGYDPNWDFNMPASEDTGRFADYSVVRAELSEAAWESLWDLCQQLIKTLAAYYKKACDRLRKIIDSEIEHRNSDAYIREELENNDHWTLDEDGSMT
jgi:hypothetical protein